MCGSSNNISITYSSRKQHDPLLTGKPAPSAPMSPTSSSASQSAKKEPEPWTVLSDDSRTAPWDERSNGSSSSAAGLSSVPSSLVRTAATGTNMASNVFGRGATAAPASGSQTSARTGRQWEMTKPRDPKDEWDHVEYPKKR